MKVEEVLYPCHHPHLHCLDPPLCLNLPLTLKYEENPLNRQHESCQREMILLMKVLLDLHSRVAIRLGQWSTGHVVKYFQRHQQCLFYYYHV